MKLSIAGLHVETGDTLKAHIEEKLSQLTNIFSQIHEADVSLKKDGHKFVTEMTLFTSGLNMRAAGEGSDFYLSTDDACSKLLKQIDKYKGRMNKHRSRRMEKNERLVAIEAQAQAFSLRDQKVEESSLDDVPDDMFAEYMPKIEHKDVRNIQTLTVDEAVMQMDLLHTNFFIFQNPNSGDLNVVYREPSGTVGWVEPHREDQAPLQAAG
jgi:putative sigma-54 modulation protein